MSSSATATTTRFRSLLPHEPLPKDCGGGDDGDGGHLSPSSSSLLGRGYIHLQGAFEPKKKKKKKSRQEGGEVDDGGEVEDVQEEEDYFWKTGEELRDAVYDAFSEKKKKKNGDEDDADDYSFRNGLPYAVLAVEVVDGDRRPPFTKIRLECGSNWQAHCVCNYLRNVVRLCPAQLFAAYCRRRQQRRRGDDEKDASGGDDGEKDDVAFGSRPLQVTQIVPVSADAAPPAAAKAASSAEQRQRQQQRQQQQQQQQPQLNELGLPIDVPCWTKSNPPKFRKLQRPGKGETLESLQAERDSTRFVFVKNLFGDDTTTTIASAPTNGDGGNGNNQELPDLHGEMADAIRSVVDEYDTSGYGVEVYVVSHKREHFSYCHVGMRSSRDAQDLVLGLQDKTVVWRWKSATGKAGGEGEEWRETTSGKLRLEYASVKHRLDGAAGGREMSRSACTSETDSVVVPGLVLVPDFLTPRQEEVLLAVLTGPHAPWAPSQSTPTDGGVVRRRVQHYGYVFDYRTADVLRNRDVVSDEDQQEGGVSRGDCPPLPAIPPELTTANGIASTPDAAAVTTVTDKGNNDLLQNWIDENVEEGNGWDVLAGIIEKTRQFDFGPILSEQDVAAQDARRCFAELNQMTVNQYLPGEGIGSHVDTPSAFGDGLISISLNGGITMEFRKVQKEGGLGQDDGDEATPPNANKKLVYLPPRSLLLMSGPARYDWEHMIVTRKTDTVNGEVLPRKLRVSLTMRTALDEIGLSPMPRVESRNFPPVWGAVENNRSDEVGKPSLSSFATPACERDHVHAFYDAIAMQWHHTRARRGVLWPGATQFLQRLPRGSVIADVGCGDGKYFPAIWEAGSYVIGTDISFPLLQTAMSGGVGGGGDDVPDSRRVSDCRRHLRDRPAVVVADCMNVPLRSNSCDAAICIAVLHHLSTRERRIRCIEELARIVKPGGMINIQAWALDQEKGSRHKFPTHDVYVPFNVQPKYLDPQGVVSRADGGNAKQPVSSFHWESSSAMTGPTSETDQTGCSKSTAQMCSEAYENTEYDDEKGLVVFKRYCHLYKRGELEGLCADVPGISVIEKGFETGNYFVIVRVDNDARVEESKTWWTEVMVRIGQLYLLEYDKEARQRDSGSSHGFLASSLSSHHLLFFSFLSCSLWVDLLK